ncbi:hypothetical protein C8R45DRAFT_1214255 [Mycena sanguinolenta]|nr:hypothetical protein C8R45DRAFT_1214255 [Mycena sanguinolenta]
MTTMDAQQGTYADEYSVTSDSMARSAIPYLHILATELWFACWTLCSPRQLRRLSLVCKLFRDICLPLIFQHQIIESPGERLRKDNWIERLHKLHRAAVRLDALAGSMHVASVHSWKFVCGTFLLPSVTAIEHIGLVTPTYERLLNTFSTTLCLYRNLRSLRLEALVIDTPFRNALSELSRLENLGLDPCDIVGRNGFVMSLRSFTISAPTPKVHAPAVPREPLWIVAPDSLHTLHLDAPSETAPLLTAFRRAQFPRLVTLSLQHLSDLDMFLAFLARCPELEVLKITTVHPDVIVSLPQYTLSHVAIPALQDLTVHGEMLGFFSLNRPITMVKILNNPPTRWKQSVEDFTPSVLTDLLTASVPLLSLSIPETSKTPEFLASITSLFPQLKQCSIHLKRPISQWACCPRRRSVSVDKRRPVLRDTDAFNDIPQDDLSDAEDDKLPFITPVRAPKDPEMSSLTNSHKVVTWICNGTASLPQQIEDLRFLWNNARGFSPAQEHEVIAALSHHYTHLCEVQIGPVSIWTREGTVWRKRGTDSYLQVVL